MTKIGDKMKNFFKSAGKKIAASAKKTKKVLTSAKTKATLKKIGTGIVIVGKDTKKAFTSSKAKKVYAGIANAGKATKKAFTSSTAKKAYAGIGAALGLGGLMKLKSGGSSGADEEEPVDDTETEDGASEEGADGTGEEGADGASGEGADGASEEGADGEKTDTSGSIVLFGITLSYMQFGLLICVILMCIYFLFPRV